MSQLRALIVDDSQPMRRSIMFALQRMGGFDIEEAQDGVEALKKFTQAPYDIVLTDINMPLMDGLKLIHHIRQSPDRAHIPIVVITTESADEDRQKALDLGADGYLVKPVQAKDVMDTVRTLLDLDA